MPEEAMTFLILLLRSAISIQADAAGTKAVAAVRHRDMYGQCHIFLAFWRGAELRCCRHLLS